MKTTSAVVVPSPYDHAIPSAPTANLMSELRWYLEEFGTHPFRPNTRRAARVQEALELWGSNAYRALFHGGDAQTWMTDAKRSAAGVELEISSDDPAVLSWPWEAMLDDHRGLVANHARIRRRLNERLEDPAPVGALPSNEHIHVLLVTARPDHDTVPYRTMARPLLELAMREDVPVQVDLLRPPTFARLRAQLRERPGYYHVLHFDGHGEAGGLVFEGESLAPDPVPAVVLQDLLRDTPVPVVVLNACRSGRHVAGSFDPFTSIAAALIKSGSRSVVAMSYKVAAPAAQTFFREFYTALHRTGLVVEAARAGRQALFSAAYRVRINPEVKFDDWLIPVVYEQQPLHLSFRAAQVRAQDRRRKSHLLQARTMTTSPPEPDIYRFVGRDSFILQIERARARQPAGILIHGLGGIGKTCLAKEVVEWLGDTQDLGERCFWFEFDKIQSASAVINAIGRDVIGASFGSETIDVALAQLVSLLRARKMTLVWDNLESASGIDGDRYPPLLTQQDRDVLARFLADLRGGQTKVIITSRSREDWLPASDCFRLELGALSPEETFELAAQVLDDLGIRIEPDDVDLGDLLAALEGHPLAIRVVLSQLGRRTADELRNSLERPTSLAGTGAAEQRLLSTLHLAIDALPQRLQEALIPLALHEGFVDSKQLVAMLSQVPTTQLDAKDVARCLELLTRMGLLSPLPADLSRIHPLLTSYLNERILTGAEQDVLQTWRQVFVFHMGLLAQTIIRAPLPEQRFAFHVYGRNFERARVEAPQVGMQDAYAALSGAIASYTFDAGELLRARRLYLELIEHRRAHGDMEGVAKGLHNMGILAHQEHQLEEAARYLGESLQIKQSLGDEESIARSYYRLGAVAKDQLSFATASEHYHKALEIAERLPAEELAASVLQALGVLASTMGKLRSAEQYIDKALRMKEREDEGPRLAGIYHQRGRLAEDGHDYDAAEVWYRKSLAISERFGLNENRAFTYFHLANMERERGHFDSAEVWCMKALEIEERLDLKQHVAASYALLGKTFQDRGDWELAKQWFWKSIELDTKLDRVAEVAKALHHLGMIATSQKLFDDAEEWFSRSFELAQQAGNERGAMLTMMELGRMAGEAQRFGDAAEFFLRALAFFMKLDDDYMCKGALHNFFWYYALASKDGRQEMAAWWQKVGLSDSLLASQLAAFERTRSLDGLLDSLSGDQAEFVVTELIRLRCGAIEIPSAIELRRLIEEAAPGIAPLAGAPKSRRDELVREALRLLAIDPDHHPDIARLAIVPLPEATGSLGVEAIGIAVLQLTGKVVYEPKRGWRSASVSQAAPDSPMARFAMILLGCLPVLA